MRGSTPWPFRLVQLWGMLGLGTDDHTGIYLPWLAIAVSLGLLMYGHLKLAGASTLLAVAAAYAILNMPFVNVHFALAGYADLWVAAAFAAAVFALSEWRNSRESSYVVLALLMASFCATLKIPGIVMAGIVFLAFVFSIYTPGKKTFVALFLCLAIAFLLIYFVGLNIQAPFIGQLEISSNSVSMPYIGKFDIEFYNVSNAMIDTLFKMINWNLLWYCFGCGLVMVFFRPQHLQFIQTEAIAITATLAMLVFVYFFTERHLFAIDFTQVNRAYLYSVTIVIFSMAKALTFRLRDMHSR